MKTSPSNNLKEDLEPYERLIDIFNSVNLPAKQREEILAWHHTQRNLILDTILASDEMQSVEVPRLASRGSNKSSIISANTRNIVLAQLRAILEGMRT